MQNPIDDLPPPQTPGGVNPPESTPRQKRRRRGFTAWWALITLIAFFAGSVGGYFLGSQKHRQVVGCK